MFNILADIFCGPAIWHDYAPKGDVEKCILCSSNCKMNSDSCTEQWKKTPSYEKRRDGRLSGFCLAWPMGLSADTLARSLLPQPQRVHYRMIYTTVPKLSSRVLLRAARYYLLPHYIVYTPAFHFISNFFFLLYGNSSSTREGWKKIHARY